MLLKRKVLSIKYVAAGRSQVGKSWGTFRHGATTTEFGVPLNYSKATRAHHPLVPSSVRRGWPAGPIPPRRGVGGGCRRESAGTAHQRRARNRGITAPANPVLYHRAQTVVVRQVIRTSARFHLKEYDLMAEESKQASAIPRRRTLGRREFNAGAGAAVISFSI
jgi:hypothetical protein